MTPKARIIGTTTSLSSTSLNSGMFRPAVNSRALVQQDCSVMMLTSMFSSFFRGLYPITFHSHASDAINSDVIAGVLRHLANTAQKLGLEHGRKSTNTTSCLQWQEQNKSPCPHPGHAPIRATQIAHPPQLPFDFIVASIVVRTDHDATFWYF